MYSRRVINAALSSALSLAFLLPLAAVASILSLAPAAASAQTPPAEDRDLTLQPEELVGLLRLPPAKQPLILNVGPRLMYAQAHIVGAEYIAAGSSSQYGDALRARVKNLPRTKFIVLYCGCCPWDRCPNIHPAYSELHSMGFTNVKMLYIANNFGADWVTKGYPTQKGE